LAVCFLFIFAVGLVALSFLEPTLLYDDSRFLEAFALSPLDALFGPFHYELIYWRPLGTSTMLAPLLAAPWLGASTALIATKAFSILLFCLACCAALACAALSPHAPHTAWPRALLLCSVLSLHPVFSETEMFLSARFDLLLLLWLPLLMLWQDHGSRAPMAAGFFMGLLMCFSKETGAAWSLLLGFLFLFVSTRRSWGAGLIGSALIFLPLRSWVQTHWPSPSYTYPSATIFDVLPKDIPASFLEGMGRQLLILIAPILDKNPAHTEMGGPAWIFPLGVAVAFACLGAIALFAWRARRQDAPAELAWLAACSCMIILTAAKTVDTAFPGEMLSMQLVPERYLAPPAIVLFILVAKQAGRASLGGRACLALLLLCAAMSLPGGLQAKRAWASEILLKQTVQLEGPATTWSTTSLAESLDAHGRSAEAQRLAIDWIERSADSIPMCSLWRIAEDSPQLSPATRALIHHRRIMRDPCDKATSARAKLSHPQTFTPIHPTRP
jgi:hypothetical protein